MAPNIWCLVRFEEVTRAEKISVSPSYYSNINSKKKKKDFHKIVMSSYLFRILFWLFFFCFFFWGGVVIFFLALIAMISSLFFISSDFILLVQNDSKALPVFPMLSRVPSIVIKKIKCLYLLWQNPIRIHFGIKIGGGGYPKEEI